MIRVVIDGVVYRRNSHGGIARYWTETLKALAKSGAKVHFDLVLSRDSVRPADVPWRIAGRLPALWATGRADLFHTTYYTHWPRVKGPAVSTAYDLIDASFPLLRPNGDGFVERQFESLRRSAAVVAISKSTRDLAAELAGIDPARIFVAYPSVAAPFSDPIPATEEIRRFRQTYTRGYPYLLHVGARKNYKNFRTILKAYCRAAEDTDRHLLVLGGRHPLGEDELDWAISSRMLDRIHFYPRVDDSALRLAYAGADAMVHASLMEGFGIPVLEALACGTGLILSDIPVYREIADGQAMFVEAGNVDAWVQALKAPVPVQSAWREDVLRRFTWEAAARVHVQAYESVGG